MTTRTPAAAELRAPSRRGSCPRPPTLTETPPLYCRSRDLPRLLALWPNELEDLSPGAHARVVAKLRAALRAERKRGVSGHWTYDLARHRQLLAAYRAEQALLAGAR